MTGIIQDFTPFRNRADRLCKNLCVYEGETLCGSMDCLHGVFLFFSKVGLRSGADGVHASSLFPQAGGGGIDSYGIGSLQA